MALCRVDQSKSNYLIIVVASDLADFEVEVIEDKDCIILITLEQSPDPRGEMFAQLCG